MKEILDVATALGVIYLLKVESCLSEEISIFLFSHYHTDLGLN